jgi:hypothetical protein
VKATTAVDSADAGAVAAKPCLGEGGSLRVPATGFHVSAGALRRWVSALQRCDGRVSCCDVRRSCNRPLGAPDYFGIRR